MTELASVTTYLGGMHRAGASDLFITAGAAPSYKINGVVTPIGDHILTPADARDLVMSIMNNKQQAELESTKEAQFAIAVADVGRFRVSCFFQRACVGMVLRRIETRIPQVAELGLHSSVEDLAMLKHGVIIFVGATGAGKSTSLASLLGYRNANTHGHIITIEDPIEFVHQNDGCIVTQREVGIDTESWDNALKNTLRQAPDVILIGEVRTQKTMEYAIHFAETGHLVMCTLHANNANQAVDRIINFFPDEGRKQLLMDLSMNLRGIVAQQLVMNPAQNGRVLTQEILIATPLIKDYLRKGEVDKLKEVMKASREQGMCTFDQDLVELCWEGKITEEEALIHADSANEVRLSLKMKRNIKEQGGDMGGLSIQHDEDDKSGFGGGSNNYKGRVLIGG